MLPGPACWPTSKQTGASMQDDVLLNIQRACEAALDMGQHLVRRERLGLPQSGRDVFELLSRGGWIDQALAESLK